MAVHDSREWQRTSKPEDACTAEGIVRVFSGSTIPRVGFMLRCAIPVFARLDTRSKMAVPVVSEPVPAVVGTATSGKSFEGMGKPLPNGALTKSRKSASVYISVVQEQQVNDIIPGKVVYKFMSFAVSITLPPPTARKASGLYLLLTSIAALTLSSFGSTLTPS